MADSPLTTFIAEISKNDISQHSPEWHVCRQKVIGGSSIATIMGINPFKSVFTLIAERAGVVASDSNIKMQWGNLFEQILREHVARDLDCTIIGDKLYIPGPAGTAYSPDGLADVTFCCSAADRFLASHTCAGPPIRMCVLFEFKCPFTRIPSKAPPKYYLPQIYMGLDIITVANAAIFVEGVFRRCTRAQFGPSSEYNRDLAPRPNCAPVAIGIIGFAAIRDEATPADSSAPLADLGAASVADFTRQMDLFSNARIHAWYAPCVQLTANMAEYIANTHAAFLSWCGDKYIPIGTLPWKLLTIRYHTIAPEEGFLAQWLPEIRKVNAAVDMLRPITDIHERKKAYDAFCTRMSEDAFDDGL